MALSGGGHRATLFSIGALMALVDRRLNTGVVQVSSVSGGSIANAFVAQRCRFETLGPGDLDPIAAELVGTIVRRGVLSRAWIALLVGAAAAVGIVAGTGLWLLGAPAVLAVLVGLFVTFAALLPSGLVVQRLLARRFFSPGGPGGRLGDLADRGVEHVFCSTDLVLGQPVTFSTWDGGTAWRMTGTGRAGQPFGSGAVRYGAGSLTLAEIVRASSAFPGIPPLRLRSNSKLGAPQRRPRGEPTPGGGDELGAARPGVLFLADGGLWNNLGSHVLREHRIVRGREGVGAGLPLLCVNSSASGAASAPVVYSVPVIAQLAAVLRTLTVLNVNTVQPRVRAITDAMARRAALGTRPGPEDPLDVVVDLADIAHHEDAVRALCRDRAAVRRSDAVHDAYRQDLVEHLTAWADGLDGAPGDVDRERLAGLVLSAVRGRPRGSDAAVGVLDRRTLEEIVVQPPWVALRAATTPGDLVVPTTLGRVPRADAVDLVLRGYANTWLSSLLIDPRHAVPPPVDVVDRVRRMAGITPS